MKICREIQAWITENISKPVETRVNEKERRCREQPETVSLKVYKQFPAK